MPAEIAASESSFTDLLAAQERRVGALEARLEEAAARSGPPGPKLVRPDAELATLLELLDELRARRSRRWPGSRRSLLT